jgi:predicted dinucleotide-binding enzyme
MLHCLPRKTRTRLPGRCAICDSVGGYSCIDLLLRRQTLDVYAVDFTAGLLGLCAAIEGYSALVVYLVVYSAEFRAGLPAPLQDARPHGSLTHREGSTEQRWRVMLIAMTIGLIGAGHIGSQIARLAVANDYDVVISNSRGPGTLSTLVAELGPRARAVTVVGAAKAGDIVVVSVPLKNYRAVPAEPLAGKIVIDTNNYYPERDGHIPELDKESTTTSELLQAHLPKSKVVKAFNHIYAAALTTDGQPAGTKNRRAVVIAGDDEGAKASVTRLLDQFGFDTVDSGALKEGWRIQRDTPGYGPRRTAEQLRRDLAAAKRYADR